MATSWQGRLVIDVVAPKIMKVTPRPAAMERFYQSFLEEVAAVLEHSTQTRRFVVMEKFTARRVDRAVAITEFITLHCQSAAVGEYSLSGKEARAVDHATITVKTNYVAMVKLFPRYMVRHAVAQGLIVPMFIFAVTARYILAEAEFHVAVVIATKQANMFVVLAEFYQGTVVRRVVVP